MSGEVEGTLSTATEREFELAGGPYAATAARLALDNLDAELDPVLAQDLRLLITEAVKNSVQHAGVGPEDSIGLKIVELALHLHHDRLAIAKELLEFLDSRIGGGKLAG